jgi:hypothetical protein
MIRIFLCPQTHAHIDLDILSDEAYLIDGNGIVDILASDTHKNIFDGRMMDRDEQVVVILISEMGP